MQSLWDEAVKFIEANESRIRVETQIIQGEEFTVWRWLQVCFIYICLKTNGYTHSGGTAIPFPFSGVIQTLKILEIDLGPGKLLEF